MMFGRCAVWAAAIAAASLTTTAVCVESHEQPVPYRGNVQELAQAAGLSQQIYCAKSSNHTTVGDAKLLSTIGGDDSGNVQRTGLFHSKSLGIVVAFEGTDPLKLGSYVNDVQFVLDEPNHRYKDELPSGSKIFYGVQNAYLKVADRVLASVQAAMKQHNDTRVSLTGHSLGPGMALVAAAHLRKELPHTLHRVIAFEPLRSGNAQFADYFVDTFGDSFHFTVNGKDWVPHLMPKELGYQHPGNMIWTNPGNSETHLFFKNPEPVHGPNQFLPDFFTVYDHLGDFFSTELGGIFGPYPALVNDATAGNHTLSSTKTKAADAKFRAALDKALKRTASHSG